MMLGVTRDQLAGQVRRLPAIQHIGSEVLLYPQGAQDTPCREHDSKGLLPPLKHALTCQAPSSWSRKLGRDDSLS